jgi:hypothetical protein
MGDRMRLQDLHARASGARDVRATVAPWFCDGEGRGGSPGAWGRRRCECGGLASPAGTPDVLQEDGKVAGDSLPRTTVRTWELSVGLRKTGSRRRTAQKWSAAEIDVARTATHACVGGLVDLCEAPVRTETWVLRRPDDVEVERVGCRRP